jgi:uncharacterized RDD family membrane protein YckC
MTPDPQSEQTKSATPIDIPLRPPEAVGSSALPMAKANLQKRAIAAIIDCVAAVLVGLIPIVGGLIATAYWLVRDGLDIEFMPHRSLGKKLVGLEPVTLDGRPVDLETSVKRNWPFAIGGVVQILLFIPIIGWLLMIPVALVALGLGLFELFLVVTSEDGRRLGDKFANTRVIESAVS